MKDLFIPYTEALALKELGFDEVCLATFQIAQDGRIGGLSALYMVESNNSNNKSETAISAPLYQQAFRWFREEHKLEGHIKSWVRENELVWYFSINNLGKPSIFKDNEFRGKTYEEAELECLKQLIEIVKEKKP